MGGGVVGNILDCHSRDCGFDPRAPSMKKLRRFPKGIDEELLYNSGPETAKWAKRQISKWNRRKDRRIIERQLEDHEFYSGEI